MSHNFIQKEWNNFMELCVNVDATPEEIWSAKMFFFGGASAMFFIFGKEFPKGVTLDMVMNELNREIHEFKRETEIKAQQQEESLR